MQIKNVYKVRQIGAIIFLSIIFLLALGLLVYPPEPVLARGEGTPQPGTTAATPVPRTDNLLLNGSAEFGFYPVAELGFEPPDIGNIPHYWGWFKSNTYGKYDIDNNIDFQLICAEDTILKTGSRNAVGIYIQSTDQPDARLGIYQTVNVVPGKDYLFSMTGTIQVQDGGSSPDINNNVILAFDHTGGQNWNAVPMESWKRLPLKEQELEFKLSGPNDPDLAKPQDYYTIVRAQSNKMTVFLGAWRRWANWRTSRFTFDCISLMPLDKVDVNQLAPLLTRYSTIDVDAALQSPSASSAPPSGPNTANSAAQPASSASTTSEQPQPTPVPAAPVEKPAEIPDSGGILETKDNWLLIVIVAVAVIGGLMGAGIWNIRRQKR
jgi:hypothetical protein